MNGRLDVIRSLIVEADVAADVGCDHGLIAEYCADSGLCGRVIASDISDICLDKARKRLCGKPNVSFVCCDGISYDCDEAIIAGMGGLAIRDILLSAKSLPKTLIVCPHRDEYTVRKTLIALGYGIDVDTAIEERGKFYSVLRAVLGGGRTELDELQLEFGADCEKPSAALSARLCKLYDIYMRAPDANSARLQSVTAAMRLQGISVPIRSRSIIRSV